MAPPLNFLFSHSIGMSNNGDGASNSNEIITINRGMLNGKNSSPKQNQINSFQSINKENASV
ncbi:hypothetical protein DERP_004762 [Dermatophagoides pteronyssinus]|uniref:Uncharacterized protein n=1 Tax=Dermatophagoides pteronyssinus TaxID=6956 RepID=A0ABQ8JPY6_DERPT|nr:hypothetical protein DERP_004762 [Dermatophagoides pteronyssinus]